jgi:hypothetical protein
VNAVSVWTETVHNDKLGTQIIRRGVISDTKRDRPLDLQEPPNEREKAG